MTCIDLISIPVSDQQRAKDFYLKLGFSLLDETAMGAGRSWIQLGFANCPTSIALVTWFPKMPPGSVHGLVLGTANLDAELTRLAGVGVVPDKVEETPWGKFATLKDPDGNSIGLKQTSGR